MIQRCLIANRGEIALRIARTCSDLGIETVAVRAADDVDPHVARLARAVPLPGRGARAYLDVDTMLDAARIAECDAIHPGYGFLAESARFAAAVEAAGRVWVGPTPEQLQLFGDKIAARALAARCDVPVLEATEAISTAAEIASFRAALGGDDVVLKAAAGGGGRGMQILWPEVDVAAALARCASEARAAFGDATLYAERFLPNVRHVEVQVLGDGRGAVTHLWERDCSLQRRHQKLIEFAPAPALDAELRARVLEYACRIARAVNYRGLGTCEFLVDAERGRCWFIEANPRLQVEHTVTEEVLGLDLVALQFAVATGRTLAELGLGVPPPAPRSSALQLRVNAEVVGAGGELRSSAGVLTRYDPPGGPGIRVDGVAAVGDALNPSFDPMLLKIVVHADDYVTLLRRAERAANECRIEGLVTNLPLLRAVLQHPDVRATRLTTRFIETELPALRAAAAALAPMPTAETSPASPPVAPAGLRAIAAPLRGSVVRIDVTVGQRVARGTVLAVLEAMKMHHMVTAPGAGVVSAIDATVGATLDEGATLLLLEIEDDGADEEVSTQPIDLDAPRADLEEVRARHALTLDVNRPEAVAKRRKIGSRTARENIADLCDPGSFIEYGALVVAAQRRRRTLEDLQRHTPADGMVGGIGTVNAAEFPDADTRCMAIAYDYTVLAGTQGMFNHKKKDRLFELAEQWALPVVFYTEGGGGRPGDVDVGDVVSCWLDLATFATWPRLSGLAPRIAINSGRCFAGNAVLFGCADITIATANSNIGLAGPAMIEGGGLGRFAPEDIGPIAVQTANGVVDLAVADEAEGTAAARRLLGYFQGRTAHWACADQRTLRHCVPEDRVRAYDVRTVIETLADTGSALELRRAYGVGIVTVLLRIEGIPFGLIANDPRHLGGAIDGAAAEKAARFLQLCDAYGLPVVSLCDTPGFMVGPESEKTAAVRRGSRLLLVSANLTVPMFAVVLRKGYGLGAQAMCGGSLARPFFTISWPTGEFGAMGLEGAVQLGFRKELEAAGDPAARRALEARLLAKMYRDGKAINVASQLEIDAVIDPAETRAWLLRGLRSAGPVKRGPHSYVDVW